MSGGMSLSCSSRHTSWGGGRVSRHIFLTLLDLDLFPAKSFPLASRQIFCYDGYLAGKSLRGVSYQALIPARPILNIG